MKSKVPKDEKPHEGDDTNNAVNQHRIIKLSNLSILAGLLTGTLFLAAVANSNPSSATHESLSPSQSEGVSEELRSATQHDQADTDIQNNKGPERNNGDSSVEAKIDSSVSGSSTHISIDTKTESSAQGQTSTESGVQFNGQELTPGNNGRINETYRDENSRTRIRGRISSDSNTSINISTNESVDIEKESE